MAKRDLIVRLEDIDQTIGKLIDMYNEIGTIEKYNKSIPYQLAFERCYEIIGEALYHIRKDFNPEGIENIGKIISLRHLLAHDYFKVNHNLLWAFTEQYLLQLRIQIREKMTEEKIRMFGSADPKLDI